MNAAPAGAVPVRHTYVGHLLLAVGVVSVLVGLLMLFLPRHTLTALGIVIGLQLIVIGFIRIWAVGAFVAASGLRVLGILLGVITVVAGVICVFRPGTSLLVIAIFIGIGWIADGVVEIVAFARGDVAHRGLALFSGALTLVAGVIVLVYPRSSLVTLTQVIGVLLLIFGISNVAAVLTGRRVVTAGADADV
ncbi:HdeD family acid-resistance protein [Rudaeicoccus suwonensis]|uniref:Uncharacterized membrane protein HdeD (DUF308 family) n=1 Tax=Rudaeicoccus suwonensis TaxID=657409 RepID=A0A561E1A4_9MICO|nr:DUF308 domain-containing protein [Rudaeicoccus suwonensis]TWE09406.1 uncharacterized membrane protein HdeD (DUF308 family) [Rudaeicoccus suwonensis]